MPLARESLQLRSLEVVVSRSTKLESDGAEVGMEVCKPHDDAVEGVDVPKTSGTKVD